MPEAGPQLRSSADLPDGDESAHSCAGRHSWCYWRATLERQARSHRLALRRHFLALRLRRASTPIRMILSAGGKGLPAPGRRRRCAAHVRSGMRSRRKATAERTPSTKQTEQGAAARRRRLRCRAFGDSAPPPLSLRRERSGRRHSQVQHAIEARTQRRIEQHAARRLNQ